MRRRHLYHTDSRKPPVMAIQGHCLNNGSASLWLSYTTKRGKFTNFLLYNKFFLKKSDISSYS